VDAEDGLHAGDQLVTGEESGDAAIGPRFQTAGMFLAGEAGGEKDNGGIFLGEQRANALAKLKAGHVRQVNIEEEEIAGSRIESAQAGSAAGEMRYRKTRRGEGSVTGAGKAGIIGDNKDAPEVGWGERDALFARERTGGLGEWRAEHFGLRRGASGGPGKGGECGIFWEGDWGEFWGEVES
jgi:hypothetical protein